MFSEVFYMDFIWIRWFSLSKTGKVPKYNEASFTLCSYETCRKWKILEGNQVINEDLEEINQVLNGDDLHSRHQIT